MILEGVAAAVGGLVIGSFVATAALRACRGEQAIRGRSACDHCGIAIGYAASVPIASYALQRGACSVCGGRIDAVHPLGELAGGTVGAFSAILLPPHQALVAAALGMVLLASSIVDAKTRRLPNILTFCAAILGVGLAAFRGSSVVLAGMIAAILCFGALTGLRALAGRGGRDPSLGFGDVKLICALALWLGVSTPWAIALAAAVGLGAIAILRPRDRRISFGPALAASGWGIGIVVQAGLWPS